jgi:hypothetical protein
MVFDFFQFAELKNNQVRWKKPVEIRNDNPNKNRNNSWQELKYSFDSLLIYSLKTNRVRTLWEEK